MNSSRRKKVQRKCKCKIRGCNLKVDALDEILSFASRFEGPDKDEAIDLLLDKSSKSTILDKETVQSVVSLLLDANNAAEESFDAVSTAIRVIDVFLIPKHKYDYNRKQFYK